MRQCKKCKFYFEEKISSSFTCNKCQSSEEIYAHPIPNPISNEENKRIVSQFVSTKSFGMDTLVGNSQSSTSIKTNVSNSNASLESTKRDSLYSTGIDNAPCKPRDEKEMFESFQGYYFFKIQMNTLDQLDHKTRLSPIQEEIVNDNDSISVVASNSSREQSPNPVLENGPVCNLECSIEEKDSDNDYIDVYNPEFPSGSKLFKCEQCRFRFNDEKHSLRHIEIHKVFPKRELFKCEFMNCNAIFIQELQLCSHLINVHLPKPSDKTLIGYSYEESDLKRKFVDFDSGSTHESPSKKHCKISVKSDYFENFRPDHTVRN